MKLWLQNCHVISVVLLSSQYPDAPSLYSHGRRLHRRTLWTEFGRTWIISIVGMFFMTLGLGGLFWNEVRKPIVLFTA